MNKIEEILKRFDEGFRNQGDWYADSILEAEALDKYKQFLLTAIKEVLEGAIGIITDELPKGTNEEKIIHSKVVHAIQKDLLSQIDKN